MARELDAVFGALARSRFRRRQRLSAGDRRYLAERGLATVMAHARRMIGERLAPAAPASDGGQTPMRGHPVFTAQHATATCCRSCLAKWHGIARGRALSVDEVEHVLGAIERWLTTRGGDVKEAGEGERKLWG